VGGQVSEAALEMLADLNSLVSVTLLNTRISRHGVDQLKASLPNCQIDWSDPNRTGAEMVLALGGSVVIGTPGKVGRPIKPGEPFPPEFFQLRQIELRDAKKPLGELPATLARLAFAKFDRLQSIDLSGTPLSEIGFLAPIHGLQDLNLARTGIGEKDLAGLPKLKRLVLDGIDIHGPGLEILAKQPELTDLSLGCPSITDLLVKKVAELKRLKRLSLVGADLSDVGIRHLEGLTNLTDLDLRQTKVTKDGVSVLQKALPQCRITWNDGTIEPVFDSERTAAEYVLSVGGAIKIRVNDLERAIGAVADLPKEPFGLTFVDLAKNQKVTDAGLAAFTGCKNVTYLALHDTQVTDMGLAHFNGCKDLTYLGLSATKATDEGLAHFKDCKNLTELWLNYTQVTDAGLAHFKDCKNLTDIRLYAAYRVTDAGLAHFKDCKNLTVLWLDGTQVTDAGLTHFKDCKNLTWLWLPTTHPSARVTDAGLAHFKNCKNLTALSLGGPQVTDAGLAYFKDCKNLNSLSIFPSQVTDAGLVHFKDCKNMAYLSLNDTQVTDAGLVHFKDCKNLVSVGLVRTRVTDAGLAQFQVCKNLIHLTLDGTQVSDAALEILTELPSLDFLSLGNTRISRHGFDQLKAALPNCKIVWSEPNRAGAEMVLALGGSVAISTPRKEVRPLKPGEPIPEGFFQLRQVVLRDVKKPLGDLPATLGLLTFAAFDRLQSIDLSGTPLLDIGCLAPIRGLQDLTLAGTGIGNQKLSGLPKAKRLVLDGNAFRRPDLESLAKQSELVELSLAAAGLVDEDLPRLPKLAKLQRLVLDKNAIYGRTLVSLQDLPELTELSLGCPSITDLLAKSLAGLKRLKRLVLVDADLSDTGIRHLEGLTNLTDLDLRQTKVTKDGVAALQKALPQCRIAWNDGVVEPTVK
jgi:Leucine-rich repeat (LRR) protein